MNQQLVDNNYLYIPNFISKEEANSPSNNNNNTNPPPGTSALLTVNLANQLLEVNDFILNNGVIVVRTSSGNLGSNFVAFSSSCPHAGANVTFIKNSNSFNCSAHGSNFSITGSVINGPASSALEKKTIEIVGSTLSVK